MEIIIRKAGMQDILPMADLIGELFSIEEDFTADRMKQEQGLAMLVNDRDGFIAVAETGRDLVGMCSVQVLVSTAEGGRVGLVEDMVVKPGFRGRGIGRRLLSYIEFCAKEAGLSRLQLLADKDNHPALSFYKQMKWSVTNLVALRKHIHPTQ